ncbi:MAG: hypothetical protein PSX36_01245 [bacterium]|nr:hypothetical protein [bacterium]
MKKILFFAALASLTAVSCKKVYTCECTTTSSITINGVVQSGTPATSSGETAKMKKDDAKTECEKNNGTTTSGTSQNGTSVTIACAIK